MIVAILFLMAANIAAFLAWSHGFSGPDVVLEVGGWMCPIHRETHPDGMRCCDVCGDRDEIILHGAFERCPRQLYDDCADCRRIVRLDRYGRCRNDAKHTVAGAIRSTRRRRA